MSTRRAGPYFFDHGAQYFTARTKPFKDFIQPLVDQGIIAPGMLAMLNLKTIRSLKEEIGVTRSKDMLVFRV